MEWYVYWRPEGKGNGPAFSWEDWGKPRNSSAWIVGKAGQGSNQVTLYSVIAIQTHSVHRSYPIHARPVFNVTVKILQTQVFWDVMPCNLTNSYSNLEESQHFHLQGSRSQYMLAWSLTKKALWFLDKAQYSRTMGSSQNNTVRTTDFVLIFFSRLIIGYLGWTVQASNPWRGKTFSSFTNSVDLLWFTHLSIQRIMGQFFPQAYMGWGVTWPLAILLKKYTCVFRTVVRTNCDHTALGDLSLCWRFSIFSGRYLKKLQVRLPCRRHDGIYREQM